MNPLRSPSFDSRWQRMKNFCTTVNIFSLFLQRRIRTDHFLRFKENILGTKKNVQFAINPPRNLGVLNVIRLFKMNSWKKKVFSHQWIQLPSSSIALCKTHKPQKSGWVLFQNIGEWVGLPSTLFYPTFFLLSNDLFHLLSFEVHILDPRHWFASSWAREPNFSLHAWKLTFKLLLIWFRFSFFPSKIRRMKLKL